MRARRSSWGANTYTLSIPGKKGCVAGPEPVATGNTVGDLELNQSTNITGAGSTQTIIRQIGTGTLANPGDRIMCLNAVFSIGLQYTFSGLTLTGGRDTSGIGGGAIIGGELSNALTLSDVRVSNNQTTGNLTPGGGGGIVITGGDFTITNSLIGGPNAPGANRNDVTLANSSLTTSGGGVGFTPSSPFHQGGTGTLTVTGTTFDHNTALGNGGGGADIYTLAFGFPGGIGTGTANFGTSTFTNNQAINGPGSGVGGGLFAESLGGTVSTTSFTSNSANNRGGAIYVAGGNGLTLNGTSAPGVTFTGNTATTAGSTISTAGAVTVTGTNVTLGGSAEVTTNGSWTNSPGSAISPTDFVIQGGVFNGNDSTTNIGGNFSFDDGTFDTGAFNSGTGVFNFNGSGAQSITGASSPAFNNLVVNKPSGTLTLGVNSPVKSNLTVSSGVFDLGAFTVNRTAAGGTLTVSNGATLRIGGTNSLPSNYTTHALGPTSTVEYNGASGTQTIAATNYGHLTSSSTGARTLASSGTIGVAGTFTPGGNSYTIAGSTVNFNGTGPQTIPAFPYFNLTSSSTGARTLASSGTISVGATFTPGSNTYTVTGSTVNFNNTGAQTIPPFGYNNLTISSARNNASVTLGAGTIRVAGAFNPVATAVTYVTTGNTVDFNGTGAQTIPAFNYNNLTSSSSGTRTLASSGTIGVGGTFTPGGNSYTVTGSTVNFNGAGPQTIAAFGYNNLTSSSTGARTLAASGTIGVAGTFTPGTNAYTVTGSTVDFSGTGAQTIPAFAYFNLTSSSSGARTLPSGQTVFVAGAFTPGTNVYTITGSTLDFNGAGPQTIAAFGYNNLTSSSSGARTLAASGTIGVAGTFTPGTNAYTVTGSTVDFSGTGAQTIPAFAYFNLTSSSSGARTLPSGQTVFVAGAFTPGTNVYTITGSTSRHRKNASISTAHALQAR